jgi:hypothetical protein
MEAVLLLFQLCRTSTNNIAIFQFSEADLSAKDATTLGCQLRGCHHTTSMHMIFSWTGVPVPARLLMPQGLYRSLVP